MSTINDATSTHDCATPGCAGTAKSTRGIHAYCSSCQSERQKNRVAAEPAKLGESKVRGIQTLLAHARNYDRARAKARVAVAEMQRAEIAYKSAARAVLGSDPESA